MKMIIDIPESQYTTLNAKTQADIVDVIDHGVLIKAIKNGTPLPKGHGRLVDAEELLEKKQDYGDGQERLVLIDSYYVLNAETIIEADKEGEQE